MPLSDLVIATHNEGKLAEFRALLGHMGWRLWSLKDASITESVPETGKSFAENARLKAVGYSRRTELPVLADDSGLEVAALDGRPGIFTTRYAGPGATDQDRIAKLLYEMQEHSEDRQCRFFCALSLAQRGIVEIEAHGECTGMVAHEPSGEQGFGYDPIFFLPDRGLTYAELSEVEKNRISHRARALDALLERLSQTGT